MPSYQKSSLAFSSTYGYTSEYQNSYIKLIYLRSRFLFPETGRFLTKDSWQGDYNRPGSLNKWNYVEGNPVNFVDPTGYIKQGLEARRADGIWSRLKARGILIIKDWGDDYVFDPNTYKVSTCGWQDGRWDILELGYIEDAANKLKTVLGGWNKLHSAVGNITVNKYDIQAINKKIGGAISPPGISPYIVGGDIVFLQKSWGNEAWYKYTFVHEFGHVWDYRTGNQLSHNLMKALGTWVCPDGVDEELPKTQCWFPYLRHTTADGQVVSPEPPADTCYNPQDTTCTNAPDPYPYSNSYGNGGALFTHPGAEDWAVSLGYYVYPEYRQPDVFGIGPERRQYVKKQIANLP